MLKPSVQVHNENGVMVAEFWDCLRLDPQPVQTLRMRYEDHLKSGGKPELVIDLLGVGFAGSASLGHFVALHRLAKGKNGRLIFCNVDPQVLEVFRVSKLEPLYTFVVDRATALSVANHTSTDEPTPTAVPKDGDGRPPSSGTIPTVPRSGGGGLLHSSRRKKLS